MKLKKAIIGILLITSIICSGSASSAYCGCVFKSPTPQLIVENFSEEEGEGKVLEIESPKSDIIYKFTIKIAQRFSSFPPRASPRE